MSQAKKGKFSSSGSSSEETDVEVRNPRIIIMFINLIFDSGQLSKAMKIRKNN